jgi:hypothetical protein
MPGHLSHEARTLIGAATSGNHTSVAGIPTPLAVAAGAVVLVLVILLVVTSLTRRHDDEDDGATFDFDE